MLRAGSEMKYVKKKLRLSNRTAVKMFQQWQRHHTIFTPQESKLIIQAKRAREEIGKWVGEEEVPRSSPDVVTSE